MFIKQSILCLRHKSKQSLREASEQRKECQGITTSCPPAWNVLHAYVRSNQRHKLFISKCTQISSKVQGKAPSSDHQVAVDCNSNPRPYVGENRCGSVELPLFQAAHRECIATCGRNTESPSADGTRTTDASIRNDTPTSCADKGLNKKQTRCRVSISKQQSALFRQPTRSAEDCFRISYSC